MDYDPFPDKTPHSILDREFLISNFTISTSADVVIRPTRLLLALTTIQNYLANFALIRTGVRLKILLLSNPMQYGLIGVSKLPYVGPTNYWATLAQQSQASMDILDIAQQEGLILDLPWMNPASAFLWRNYSSFYDWAVTFHAFFINTLSTDTSDAVHVHVFAHFIDLHAAAFVGDGFSEVGELQSGKMTVNPVKRLVDFSRTLTDLPRNVASSLELIANNANWPVLGGSTYQAISSATGSLSAAAAPFVPSASTTTTAAIMGAASIAASAAVSGATKQVVAEAVKTITQQPVKMTMCNDLSAPAGGSQSGYAILGDNRPCRHLSSPRERNFQRISEFLQIPTYYSSFTLSDGTPHCTNISIMSVNSYASYFNRMFRFWRGSSKLICYCVLPHMASARLQVTLHPWEINATDQATDVGNLPTEIISIRGPHVMVLDIPFISTQPWLGTKQTLNQCVIFKLLDTIPQSFDVPINLSIVTFIAAAEDFMFTSLQSCVPAMTPSSSREVGVLQSYGSFSYMCPFDEIYSILTRFSTRTSDLDNFVSGPLLISSINSTPIKLYDLDNFDYVCNLFKFWTGSTNQKAIFDASEVAGTMFVTIDNSVYSAVSTSTFNSGNSALLTVQSVWPVMEWTFPYIEEYPFDSIFEPNGNYPTRFNQAANISNYFVSAGHDFRLMYALPVPNWYTPTFPSPTIPLLDDKGKNREKLKDSLEIGEFQSSPSPRTSGTGNFTVNGTLDESFQYASYDLGAPDGNIAFDVTINQVAFGSDPYFVFCALTRSELTERINFDDNPFEDLTTVVFGSTSFFTAESEVDSHSYSFSGFSHINPGVDHVYLWVQSGFDTTDNPDFNVDYLVTVKLSPYQGAYVLTCPQIVSDTIGMITGSDSGLSTRIQGTVGADTPVWVSN